jgi:hypothetical protein
VTVALVRTTLAAAHTKSRCKEPTVIAETDTRQRELYVHHISTQTISNLKAHPHDFAEQVYDWLARNMPEELDDVRVDTHAIEVAAVHLGLCD